MTTNDDKIIDLQRHSVAQDARINNLDTKFEMFMQEMKDFKNEMRDRDNQRHAENLKLQEAIDSINKHTQNLTTAALVGIGAMVLSGGAIAVAVVYSVLNR